MKKFTVSVLFVFAVAMAGFVFSGLKTDSLTVTPKNMEFFADTGKKDNKQEDKDKIAHINELYEKFQEEKYEFENPEDAFYDSEFYIEFVDYLSTGENTAFPVGELSYKLNGIDIMENEKEFVLNGKSYKIRITGYNADYFFYTKSLVNSPVGNKNIYVQIYNDNEFYFAKVSERSNNYFSSFITAEGRDCVYIVISGINGANYPHSGFLGTLEWNGNSLKMADMLRLHDDENVAVFEEKNNNMCYTVKNGKYKKAEGGIFPSGCVFAYDDSIKDKFVFYGSEGFYNTVRYGNFNDQYANLMFADISLDNSEKKIYITSEDIEGGRYYMSIGYRNGVFSN